MPLGRPKGPSEMEGQTVMVEPGKSYHWDRGPGGVCGRHGIPQVLLNGPHRDLPFQWYRVLLGPWSLSV